MKKFIVILVAIIGFGISAYAGQYDGKYCNEDGVELQLLSTGKFQIYRPGEGIRNGTYKVEQGSLTLDDGVQPIYASIYWHNGYAQYEVSITGLKSLRRGKCK